MAPCVVFQARARLQRADPLINKPTADIRPPQHQAWGGEDAFCNSRNSVLKTVFRCRSTLHRFKPSATKSNPPIWSTVHRPIKPRGPSSLWETVVNGVSYFWILVFEFLLLFSQTIIFLHVSLFLLAARQAWFQVLSTFIYFFFEDATWNLISSPNWHL